MSKLQSIENALKAINETVFQELCDGFLIFKNENYSALRRAGSQSGKQKTTKGTPDTFLLLPNGKYILVEYSTNISKGIKKLEEDLKKCIDEQKTGISCDKIEEVVFCINFNLNSKEIEELQNLLPKTNIKLTIYSLDSLALELHFNYRNLAHDYLKLPLDTGQIVSIDTFIKEYNKAANSIATPLDNTFLYRENELQEIKTKINQNNFVIITGAPGVGKTKLALEAINRYLAENLDYTAYCVSYKNCELLDDLYQYFNDKKNYILFIDDANRIDAFNQITGFYKGIRTGNLKILITVRDYAYQDIYRCCQNFLTEEIYLSKFTDEQIIGIIKAEPFNILNSQYHQEIVRIADGNPRLAIMASLLAIEKQNIYALFDASDLFEKYFATFVDDKGEFSDKLSIQCLGIISFFYAIPYKNKEIITPILDDFGIDYYLFFDKIEKLDRLEIVEIQFEYVKIPEQNLSTFFFYKAFIKENLLSFETLLSKYFDNNKNKSRFKDCVIPANNTFGYDNVMKKLQPILQRFWNTIKNDEEKAFNYLDVFWFYLQDETLDFVYNIINCLPISTKTNYEVKYEENKFTHTQNKIIELLGKFFIFRNNKLKDTIELSFEYVRKLPEHLPELIHKIRKTLIFDKEDKQSNFTRQNTLFKILIEGLKNNDNLYSVVFYELSKTFLDFQFQQFQYIKRGKNRILSQHQYTITNNKYIHQFRKNIWENVKNNYLNYPNQTLELLQKYAQVNYKSEKDIINYDIPFVISIIETYLNTNSFEHCRYVQNQIRQYKKQKITHNSFDILAKKFTNPLYEMFLKLDWDYCKNKESHNFKNHQEFNKLKETEIRNSFVFSTNNEIKLFISNFIYLKKSKTNELGYNNSLDLIIDENCIINFELGCQLLLEIVINNNKIGYIPYLIFKNHLKTKERAEYIWNILSNNNFNNKIEWLLIFFDNIDNCLINEKYTGVFLDTIKNTNTSIHINLKSLYKHINIFQETLKIIISKNESEDNFIYLDWFYYEDDFNYFENNLDLLKKTYLQQNIKQDRLLFDYDKNILISILQKKPDFLLDYVNSLYLIKGNEYYLQEENNLYIIWQIQNIEPILKNVFELVIKKNIYSDIGEHFCNSFFLNLQEDFRERASNFLLEYCRNNYSYSEKMNVIVDIACHSMEGIFNEILLLFVSLTQDIELFKKISWVDTGGVYSNDDIIGDIEAEKWSNILSIVEQSPIGIKLMPIKRYLENQINDALKCANWERKQRFIANN
ncbi:ATP-binding protein [Stenoxybacter acetivorans]|uniref:nSTAND3 domain-containing NTPase n=1 Tax=Stenoxybacter acetivorans TaxID=422441 RepID=UPI00056B01F0|nr:ATP-binding protein [Stenoxybacter acetivorans]